MGDTRAPIQPTYLTLAQLRELGVYVTRRMCGACRRYTNFAPGAVYGPLPSDPTKAGIQCHYSNCACWIDVEANLVR